MSVRHDLVIETDVWNAYAKSAFKEDAEPTFCWTQYAGHGPGAELLGEAPAKVLEIGCGTGRAVAYLAERGITAHGVDLSPLMVKKTSEKWASTGAVFHQGEAIEYLRRTDQTYDAIYSIFGAAWFADPLHLLPLVHQRLRPRGVFAFSQPPAIPGAYGPQGMYKGGFAGKPMYTYRYSYTPRRWKSLLSGAGFRDVVAQVIDAPTPGHVGTLLVRAEA
ncbi:class I SAM-dependent methyltransferase [Streptomyces sp. DG2A-72]|uniref:class I SAM-dependent methyltransferase n=1 Tax=Streptomyces sp. DG2A-72 TaxID=3051386 RepID=UPI00265C2BAA|nr:class I SAM-dependent methyltransferase [Streptomyces sp. DG2A-72]MDO0933933.1 class I SAM-dependent methyltransferase [Streptomyces sp. DG2A-72]